MSTSKNGKTPKFTDEQLKGLAELIIQCDERIEQLTDEMLALKLLAFSKGWPMNDVPMMQVAVRERSKVSGLQKSQRQRYRKSLGLDE